MNLVKQSWEWLINHWVMPTPAELIAEELIQAQRTKLRHQSPELILAIKAALAQEQEPVAWQPIETAPKDGTMILICLPRQTNLVIRGRYNNIHRVWQVDYEDEGGITRPMYFHEGDLWHPIPPLFTTPS